MGTPEIYIQWKGTKVCADLQCACGSNTHIDADFAYYIRCSVCRALYKMPYDFVLKPVPKDQEDRVNPGGIRETEPPGEWWGSAPSS